jgi:phosphatidylglycerophosphatase A
MRRKYTIDYFFATFFYTGYIPSAPGTWGTLAGLLFWLLISVNSNFNQILLIVATFIAGILVAGSIERKQTGKDPGFIVIDEVVGIWITLFFIPAALQREPLQLILAFILFRFFDITKIFPVKNCEKLKGGLGIMADDVMAGLMAGLILYLLNHFVL